MPIRDAVVRKCASGDRCFHINYAARMQARQEIAEWVGKGSPRLPRPGSRLVRLGDWDLRYGTPG
jgi:hypothetical protein